MRIAFACASRLSQTGLPTVRVLACVAVMAFAALAGVAYCAESKEPSFELPATDDGLPGAGPIRRYDWFRNLWRERRSAWAQRQQADQGAVVFLGDSITQGWGDDFGGAFPGMQAANRGISGDTTRGMLLRLDDDVLALKPAGVVILAGTNDLEEQAEPATIAENLTAIIAAIHAHNAKTPVILCQVMPSHASKSRSAERIQAINNAIAKMGVQFPQVTVLETYPLFADAEGNAKPAEFPDLLHPNELGYAKWAASLRPLLATAGLLEKDIAPFELEEGFELLFNGHDLTGWGTRRDDTMAPIETFDGKTASSDGRYQAIAGRLVVTTPAEVRREQKLWTTPTFGSDFTLRLEFRATPNADSGIYVRGPQLQCRDYLVAGPFRELKKYRPQDWNEIEVVVRGKTAHCTCNGELLEIKQDLPAEGPIGLEGDRGQMEYRRLRIKRE